MRTETAKFKPFFEQELIYDEIMKLPIYKPKLSKEQERAELVRMLARLLEDRLISTNRNLPETEVVLSDNEYKKLQCLIEQVSSDRSFQLALAFVDGLLGSRKLNEENLREIYLSQRKQRGYSRSLASGAWHQFKTRLGGPSRDLSAYLRAAQRMPFDHFARMEDRLLDYFKVQQKTKAFLLEVIHNQQAQVEAAREILFEKGAPGIAELEEYTQRLLSELKQKRDSLSSNQVAGLTTVVANTTALFSTRDWSVAGTISTMAGGLVFSIDPKQK